MKYALYLILMAFFMWPYTYRFKAFEGENRPPAWVMSSIPAALLALGSTLLIHVGPEISSVLNLQDITTMWVFGLLCGGFFVANLCLMFTSEFIGGDIDGSIGIVLFISAILAPLGGIGSTFILRVML